MLQEATSREAKAEAETNSSNRITIRTIREAKREVRIKHRVRTIITNS